MLFNVSGLIQEGIGATREYEVEGSLFTDGRKPERVSGTAELLRTKTGVLVRARLDVLQTEACSRCLRPLEEKLRVGFEEEFQATVDLKSGQPLSERPAEDAFLIDSNHILDLTEAVRQYREASSRMQPLCRPDCRGLCPRCGSDLNGSDCGCDRGLVDDRWAGLAALRGAIAERKE